MEEYPKYLTAILGAAIVLLIPRVATAQYDLPVERVTTSIDASHLIQLKGTVHPLARAQNETGVVDPSLRLERITLMFQPTPAQQADLEALLAAQQNPTSPSYHQWLSPEQFGDRFGIARTDLAKVSAWLESLGFAVVETPASRNFVVLGGTAGQFSAAFHTEIRAYEASGQKFYANSSEPSV